jgi:hypothetical protein
MHHKTTIIYLPDKPGVGKFTIAKELAKTYGFIVCDNQLINNPIFELLQHDGYAKIPEFAWDSIAKIRTEIFSFLSKVPQNNYVLTNCLADTSEDKELYEQVKLMAMVRGSLFVPVQLLIVKEEHLKRLTQTSRRERLKSIDTKDSEDNQPFLSIDHCNFLELEVSNLSAEDAARRIMDHINKLKTQL